MSTARTTAVSFFLIAVLTAVLAIAAGSRGTEAVFPGTNGKIAFTNFTGNDTEIWTMNPDGTGRTKLTDNEFVNSLPAFSSDGEKIGFFRNTGDEATRGLYTMNADGSSEQLVPTSPDDSVDPSWAPDGNRIVYARLLGPADIFIMNLDGTNETNLTPLQPGENRHPDWSPLGDKIAWSNGDIWIMDTDGGNKVNLTNTPLEFEDNPDWSPDGLKIIFDVPVPDTAAAGFFSYRNIATINADGTGLQMITNDPNLDQSDPVFSPDGLHIAYVQNPADGVSAAGFGVNGIVVADTDGSNAQVISPDFPDDVEPDWGVDEPAEPPTPQPTPTPSPTPAGEGLIWGDDNCSGQADPVDALLALRFDSGLSTNTGDCPDMGTEVDVIGASLHLWGDVDCSDAVDPVDTLKTLRYDAGLTVSQPESCPDIGSEVQILS